MTVLRHVVLFRIHDAVSDEEVQAAVVQLRSLGALEGIVDWRVEESLDTRKGRVIVEEGTFRSEEAFRAFQRHPSHVAMGGPLAKISDWWTADYIA